MEPMSNFMAKFDLVDSTFDQLAMTAIMIVIWTMLFLLVNTLVTLPKMRVKQANDTRNRIVSIVHGLLTLLMSVYIIFLSGETFDVEYNTINYSGHPILNSKTLLSSFPSPTLSTIWSRAITMICLMPGC
jgi:hypothetical protein